MNGKTCLVTAAGQGIGRASAIAMAKEGAKVIATDINRTALESLDGDNIETRLLNVRDPEEISNAAAAHPNINVLFNCAGFVANGTFLDCDEEEWTFSIDLNVASMYRVTRAFLPLMLKAGGGSVNNMASVASSLIAVPNRFVYAATKAAVIGMTKAVAADFITQGIRCNAICPGTVDSPSLQERLRSNGDYDAAKTQFAARQPMGRIASANKVADLVVYLASDESSYTTGQVHVTMAAGPTSNKMELS